VKLGDRDVTRMGLGTNRLTNSAENVAFIRAAVDAGIGVIDTAHLYAGGQSEETIGEALGDTGNPTTVVATKGGYGPGEGRRDVLTTQIETSLRRLRTNSIELYYMHRVHPETPLEESLGVIRDYIDRGQIRHVGLSEVGIEQIEQAQAILPIAAVQNQYNVSQRKWDDVVDYCTREGICFVPFHPLHVDTGGALGQIAERHEVSPRQIALAWLLHRSPMILPIPGTLSIAHVKENLAALDIQLTDEEFAGLGNQPSS
jgi:pyridoxine 4-dehydrogenase